jgi:hypothetical protein
MKVKFEQSAEEALAYIMRDDEALGYKILVRLKMLEADPFPHQFSDVTVEAKEVIFLKKQGMDVRSLKCSEFLDFRVFYFVDELAGLIIVCEIISRKMAFSEDAPHIERIKSVYRKYFKGFGSMN